MKEIEEKKKKISAMQDMLNMNNDCEQHVKQVMTKRRVSIENSVIETDKWLTNTILSDFDNRNVTRPMLSAFCHVRKFDNIKRGTKKDIPNSKHDLSVMAHSLVNESIKMKLADNVDELLYDTESDGE